MNNKQLNNLVISYKENGCEDDFRSIYEEVQRRWKIEGTFWRLSQRLRIDESELESLANFELIKAVKSYNLSGNFYNYLSTIISRRSIDKFRSVRTSIENEISLQTSSKEDDEENPLIKFLVAANAEDEAVENLQRKSDQRQLIASLIDKAPEKCRQALKAYIESDYSYTKAAKLIGVKYDTVKRRVENIANYFDPNKFGQVSDYFTEPTQRTA